jgi:hypothetical protein
MKLYLWLGLLLFLLLPTTSVMACSGGGGNPPLTEILNREFFVEATVLEVDAVGQNAILRVERYLKGVGTSYLAVVNYTRGFHAIDQRGYDKGCNYGLNSPLFQLGERGYFGFSSNGDGTYNNTYGYGSVSFPIKNGTISNIVYDESGYREEHLSIQEFEERAYEILGERNDFVPGNYDSQMEYPLLRPVYFTTESGRHYVMEVDRHLREIDSATEAVAISPDGAHHAFRLDENTIIFSYCTSACSFDASRLHTYYNGELREVPRIPAQSLIFSPNSNIAAVWNEASLGLYLFDNQTFSNYGRQMEVVFLGSHDFRGNLAASARLVSWSADSSTIVFLDDAGIWRWHIYTMAAPELVLPAANLVSSDAVTMPEQIEHLELSQSGRYLRYGNGSHWNLLDLITGESFANAIVIPDESNFIYINSDLPDTRPDWNTCRPPFHQTCPFAISQAGDLVAMEWLQDGWVIFFFCDESTHNCSSFALVWAWDSGNLTYGNWDWGWFDNIAHSSDGNKRFSAIQRGDYEIELWYDGLNEIETYHAEHYDLSTQLDSPIAHIEWGQAIFYEGR